MKETIREDYWEISDLLHVQRQYAHLDSYNSGLYNGLELALSILQKRKPEYVEVGKPLQEIK